MNAVREMASPTSRAVSLVLVVAARPFIPDCRIRMMPPRTAKAASQIIRARTHDTTDGCK
jgi:hypothetical protein